MELGNLSAMRDWTDAEDCVQAVWKMLNQEDDILIDYVVASGTNHTIREFVEKSFDYAGVVGKWEGEDTRETYVYQRGNFTAPAGTILVKVNPTYYRPAEVQNLCGDFSLIKKQLGWEPNTTFDGLVKKMTFTDLKPCGAIYVNR